MNLIYWLNRIEIVPSIPLFYTCIYICISVYDKITILIIFF